MTFTIMPLIVKVKRRHSIKEILYLEWRIFSFLMLSDARMSVFMLGVMVMTVVAPFSAGVAFWRVQFKIKILVSI